MFNNLREKLARATKFRRRKDPAPDSPSSGPPGLSVPSSSPSSTQSTSEPLAAAPHSPSPSSLPLPSLDAASATSVPSTASTTTRIRLATEWLSRKTKRTIAEAARRFKLDYQQLRRRHRGLNKTAREAQQDRQLLTPAQEQVLVDWCDYLSDRGTPVDQHSVRPRILHLAGREPGKNWFRKFLRRHPEIGQPLWELPPSRMCRVHAISR